ncbi:hypothetical protein BC624_10826 [Flavobacterium granuli]|uniref:Uncharacterized protein n=1 Tax=Flavobacterium granuli TaxID=280093 RepID=A0A1M5R3U4_9FLAO|nr:hypothetical protein BC624_10826 [Flavobacterium granuli]SHH20649.1 hypothetical protein SAMN05443373_10926 [Flavobacterium granuli]
MGLYNVISQDLFAVLRNNSCPGSSLTVHTSVPSALHIVEAIQGSVGYK